MVEFVNEFTLCCKQLLFASTLLSMCKVFNEQRCQLESVIDFNKVIFICNFRLNLKSISTNGKCRSLLIV